MARHIAAIDVPSLLKKDMCVYVGGASGEPHAILDEIISNPQCAEGVNFIQQPLAALNKRDLSAIHPSSEQCSFFVTPFLDHGLRQGKVKFIPKHMRDIYEYLAQCPIDIALLLAARDVNGVIRYAFNMDYVEAVLESTGIVVVEVSDAFRSPLGSAVVVEADVDYIVPSHTVLPVCPIAPQNEAAKVVGRHVASLIDDGDCIQTGIGAIPSEILQSLSKKSDLGLHSGLIDDAAMDLICNGNITGSRKQLDKGKHIVGMALGSKKLLEWTATSDNVIFRSANYTHDTRVIRKLDSFVSINSAIEVDLYGQINSEVIKGKQISGTGGAVDFMRASKLSLGGRSIVAMTSTARRGQVSRIVSNVEMVTALRSDVDIVVTEYGIANLGVSSLPERAERLIAIAHPDYRAALQEGWIKNFGN